MSTGSNVYDPYGNIISVKDGSGNSVNIATDTEFNHAYTYRGYRFDSESGLYFLQSRYYAAGIGRFLTKDSIKGRSTDPGSLNRYAYCEGDPVNSVDPSGHDVFSSIKKFFTNTFPAAINTIVSWFTGKSGTEEKSNNSPAIRSSMEGVTDSALTYGVINKLNETKEVTLKAPSLGPAFQVKQVKFNTGVKLLKGVSKVAGPVAIGSWAYDMYQDYHSYRNSYMIAMGLTTGAAVAGVATGLVIGAIGVPVAVGVIAGIGVGIYANVKVSQWKRELIGY